MMAGILPKILFSRRFWLIAILIVSMANFWVMAQRVKILTLERDRAQAARVIAESTIQTIRRESILITESLERARKEDNDRGAFITENSIAIEKGRADGDGPLAPVLRDTLERVRNRYDKRLPDNRNP